MSSTRKIVCIAVALLCFSSTVVAQRHASFRWRGFYSAIGGAYAFNVNRNADINGVADTMAGFELEISCGYQFSRAAGVGVGINYIHDINGIYNMLPTYVELRSHILRTELTPYTVVQVGYNIPLGVATERVKVEEGGLYFATTLGIRYSFNKNIALGLHGGYQLLNLHNVSRKDSEGTPILADVTSLHIVNAGLTLYF